ncbi:MAG: glycoside hydrolase family 2, candidate beta-glycosidase [Sphingobacteriaceae bacterium]|jgi:beta-galactosidase|nr:glycoside hydrolase family 2, candidate beta-glycosidase [Sphingobacteriaceae bacterium]
MKRFALLSIVSLAIAVSASAKSAQLRVRARYNFDKGWKFSLTGNEAAIKPSFNDSNWKDVNLPHDWSVEGEYSLANGTDSQSGYLPAGIGWYRKTFDYDPRWQDRSISLQFDGVYRNSEVWINGHYLGKRPNGNIGFSYAVEKYLLPGKNRVAVKVDQSKPLSARWYTGSGINRHVWLLVTNLTHLDTDHALLTTSGISSASVEYVIPVLNISGLRSGAQLITEIISPDGQLVGKWLKTVAKTVEQSVSVKQSFTIKRPLLWSPDRPSLYKIRTRLYSGTTFLDEITIPFGIRKLEFSGAFGFKLNDVPTKIKGMCMHEDAGPFGTAVPDETLLRKLKLLKEMGTNAIRTSHNPFSPQFYDMCDSLGIMVLNEAFDGWEKPKARDDYGNDFIKWWENDLSDFVYRDRNHPSVIMWSIGNEVSKPTEKTQQKLINLIHKLDPTRPVTQGGVDPTRGMASTEKKLLLDVQGFNGDGEEKEVFENFHQKFPDMPMVGTEIPHTYSTRGVYHTSTHWRRRDFPAPWEQSSATAGTLKGIENKIFPIPDLAEKEVFQEEKTLIYFKNDSVLPIANDKPWSGNLFYQSSYDNAAVRTSARKAWQRVMQFPYVMGEFRWTAFDYLGESYGWPARFGNKGVIDVCGFPKDNFYLYQSLWTEKPMVHMLPHWTHTGKEGVAIPIIVYTNCDSVRLSLNGRSLGTKQHVGEQLVWHVPYAAGKITATAYRNGKAVATDQNQTAGATAKLSVSTDKTSLKANGTDLLVCEITVTDQNGIPVPLAGEMLNFKVTGASSIKVADNGDPLDLSNYNADKRRAFRGKCLLVLQSTESAGDVDVEISGPNLETYKLNIKSSK